MDHLPLLSLQSNSTSAVFILFFDVTIPGSILLRIFNQIKEWNRLDADSFQTALTPAACCMAYAKTCVKKQVNRFLEGGTRNNLFHMRGSIKQASRPFFDVTAQGLFDGCFAYVYP